MRELAELYMWGRDGLPCCLLGSTEEQEFALECDRCGVASTIRLPLLEGCVVTSVNCPHCGHEHRLEPRLSTASPRAV